jgi:hypothetical protein
MSGLAPGTPAEAEATRVAAIKELLDRGYGKAAQPLSGEDGNSPIAMHLLAAQAVSAEIIATMDWREQRTIDGRVEPATSQASGEIVDLWSQPPPLE